MAALGQKSTAESFLNKKVAVYTTAENTAMRIDKSASSLSFQNSRQPLETQVCVFVDPTKSFQSLTGIGGAITDASAEVFAKLSEAKQKEFLKAYYDKSDGIGYSLMRTNIASCDFSSDMYDYIKDGDKDLKTFSIDHDKKYRIPLLKKAIATAGGKLTLFVSPWSPPAFMKDNKDRLHGGKLLPEFSQSWANYYVAYVKALEKENIPVWGLSVQNEPMATQIWESCIYTAEGERDFVKNFLGPTLKKDLPGKKLIFWDHNRDLMNNRASVMLNDPDAAQYIWGMGFHWYETWAGGEPMFGNVGQVHEDFPNVNLMFTEGCIEKFDPTKYQLWANGERYGKSMINDFNNGTVAWTDWNILLDDKGGPNHVGNFCFAPVHADAAGELIYTPSFYYIGHFSKFIRPEAKRLSTSVSRSSLLSTSFRNQNGEMVSVIMNQSDAKVNYKLIIGTSEVAVDIPAHAIQTLVY
nr:glycoside hydrolase family 30 protein [Flavobacterium silvaticum]